MERLLASLLFLTDGAMVLSPGKEYYSVGGIIYQIASNPIVKYVWNKYSLATQYTWKRYSVITETAYRRYRITATLETSYSNCALTSINNPVPVTNGVHTNTAWGLVYSTAPTRSGNIWRPSGSGTSLTITYTYDGSTVQVISWAPTSGYLCYPTYDCNQGDSMYVQFDSSSSITAKISSTYLFFTLIPGHGYRLEQSNTYLDIVYGNYTEGCESAASYKYTRSSSDDRSSQGSYIDKVVSATASTYPSNNISGDYWYVSSGSEQMQGEQVGTVESYAVDAYPDNGIKDGYWYVKQ